MVWCDINARVCVNGTRCEDECAECTSVWCKHGCVMVTNVLSARGDCENACVECTNVLSARVCEMHEGAASTSVCREHECAECTSVCCEHEWVLSTNVL